MFEGMRSFLISRMKYYLLGKLEFYRFNNENKVKQICIFYNFGKRSLGIQQKASFGSRNESKREKVAQSIYHRSIVK